MLRRPLHGQYEALMAELCDEDPTSYRNFLRISPDMFNELLHVLGPRITKNDHWLRKSINLGLSFGGSFSVGGTLVPLRDPFRFGGILKVINQEAVRGIFIDP